MKEQQKDENLKETKVDDENLEKDNADSKDKAEKKEHKDPLKEKIEALEKEVASWKDKTYRTLADTDNLRKSYEKDHQNMVKYRGQPFVEKLVPTLDSFYLVLKNEPTDPNLKNYLIGFQMIYNSMLSALNEEGVEQINPPLNKPFDHNTMQAIDVRLGEKDDMVVEVSKPGYMLRDRLIRPAMVVVSKTKIEENSEDEKTQEEKGE